MREMGWTWADYLAAPADLVEEIAERLEADGKWRAEAQKREKKKQQQARGRKRG